MVYDAFSALNFWFNFITHQYHYKQIFHITLDKKLKRALLAAGLGIQDQNRPRAIPVRLNRKEPGDISILLPGHAWKEYTQFYLRLRSWRQ